MFGKSKDERRGELRKPANRRAILLAGPVEIECRITDESKGGVRLRLDRRLDVKGQAILIDMTDATALSNGWMGRSRPRPSPPVRTNGPIASWTIAFATI